MQGGHSLAHSRAVHLPNEPADGHFPVVVGQHDSATRPSVWHVPPALPPCPDTSEAISLPEIDCWSWWQNPTVQWVDRELPKLLGMGDHLKADAAKPSQIADELFCLVVPIDGANCSLLDFLSH